MLKWAWMYQPVKTRTLMKQSGAESAGEGAGDIPFDTDRPESTLTSLPFRSPSMEELLDADPSTVIAGAAGLLAARGAAGVNTPLMRGCVTPPAEAEVDGFSASGFVSAVSAPSASVPFGAAAVVCHRCRCYCRCQRILLRSARHEENVWSSPFTCSMSMSHARTPTHECARRVPSSTSEACVTPSYSSAGRHPLCAPSLRGVH